MVTATATVDQVLCAALDIGVNILRFGGEIRRVEDTVSRILYAYGAEHVEVFCLTSWLNAAVRMPDGVYQQQMRRVSRERNRLFLVEEMNALSRALCAGQITPDEVHQRIHQARKKAPYPLWIILVAMCTYGFTAVLYFGGSWRDGICAALAGLPVLFLSRNAPKHINPLITTAVSAFLSAAVALALVKVGLGESIGFVMVGTAMHIVPGLAFGNALRDMMGGDTLSGMMGLFHTVLVALMMALGFAGALLIFRDTSTLGVAQVPWYLLIPSGVAFTLGYAVQADLLPRRLPWVALGGALASALGFFALPLGDFMCNLLAVFAVTLYCEGAARLVKAPVITFLAPSIISLVPGSFLYYTLHGYINGMYGDALVMGGRMLAVFFGIAAGILTGSLLSTYLFGHVRRAEKKFRGEK